MNVYTSVVVHNVALMTLTALLVYYTGSLWSLLALIFMLKADKDKVE